MKRLTLLMLLALTACGTKPVVLKAEICGNGKDDDENGLTDCKDPDCSGQAGCPIIPVDGGTNYGTCAKCGNTCTKQTECLTNNFQNDTPPAECVGGKCQLLNTNVQVAFEVDTASLVGFPPKLRSLNTRVISKVALDGSAVTCLLMKDAASGRTEAFADQIEKSGKFNLRGYDVSPVNANGGEIIKQPFMNVATGGNFLIWTEVWGGPVGTLSKLPSGSRFVWGCYESGTAVADVTAADNCAPGSDAGCRTLKVKLTNQPDPP